MRHFLAGSLLLMVLACAPATYFRHRSEKCSGAASQVELLENNWLQQGGRWRLRQSALLEIGHRKVPLEGFLILDLEGQQAHLLAMNEVGLVMFELLVTKETEQLLRAIPQLQQVKGFAQGVGQSLRKIYLSPLAQGSDHLQERDDSQRLWRLLPGGSLGFIYDCQAELRETRLVADSGNWQVNYDQYNIFDGVRIPEQIVLNDFQHGVKLSLWIREVKRQK